MADFPDEQLTTMLLIGRVEIARNQDTGIIHAALHPDEAEPIEAWASSPTLALRALFGQLADMAKRADDLLLDPPNG